MNENRLRTFIDNYTTRLIPWLGASSRMPARIRPAHRRIQHIAVAIKRLRIGRPPRVAHLLALRIAQLEPEELAIFAIQRCAKAYFVEVHRQRFQGDALQAAAGIARHHNYPR